MMAWRSTGGICSVCTHPKLEDINRALLSGTSLRDVAGRYGLEKSSLSRHKKCNGAALARTAEARADRRGETLAGEIRRKKGEAEELQASAVRDGDPRTALMAIKVYADLVRLLMDATGGAVSASGGVKVTLRLPGAGEGRGDAPDAS